MAASASGHAKYLERQVEFIRDSQKGDIHDIVVKVRPPGKDDPTFVATVAEALHRRGLSSSARDLLPVERRILQASPEGGGRSRPKEASILKGDDRSLAAQVAQANLSRAAHAALRKRNLDALRPLLDSEVVKETTAAVAAHRNRRKRVKSSARQEPVRFWTSTSAVLSVRGQDLSKLIKAPSVQDIFLNQKMAVPPVVATKQVPQSVEDNKVSSWGIRTIGALSSWGAFGCRGKGIVVGLLDTGVDPNHPDLKGKIANWAEFDEKGNLKKGSKPHDSDQHGTHCAGTIVGGNASGRWIGVAPEAKIAAGLVLNGERGGTHAQILAGLEWAINQQVDVISMSLGAFILGPEVPSTYSTAILSALKVGIPVVTAIGNQGSQTSGSPGNDFFAFAVGATDPANRAAGFSGGRTQIIRDSEFFAPAQLPLVYSKPDVSAPGVAVFSSIPGGKWEHLNGTSMATPHVAGAIALLLSATEIKSKVAPTQRAFVIQDLLSGSAEELGEAGQNHRFGFGPIDILRMIGFAKERGY